MSGAFSVAADKRALEEGDRLAPRFDAAGLVTAIAQDARSGEILMLAHMNVEALRLTLATGIAITGPAAATRCGRRARPRGNCRPSSRCGSTATRTPFC
jgi:phosphoribosyl-AMP cyclohydrolase